MVDADSAHAKAIAAASRKNGSAANVRHPLEFLYDFVECEGDEQLKAAIWDINRNGYALICVTQRENRYKVFFRRACF